MDNSETHLFLQAWSSKKFIFKRIVTYLLAYLTYNWKLSCRLVLVRQAIADKKFSRRTKTAVFRVSIL